MKIALVHDYIKEYGGAERVLEALHEIWPDAPVYTSVYLPEYLGPHKKRFAGWDIRTSWFQHMPYAAKLISPFRLIAPFVFQEFDFSGFDVVIVSATGAYTPNMIKIRNPKSEILNKSQSTKYQISNPLHVCYCHTPPRYLYGYATAREWKKHVIFRVMGELANHFLRLMDFKSSQNVDYFIANSQNIAGRIQEFYRKDSIVIYPPVDISASSSIASSVQLKNKKLNANHLDAKRYFIAGGRLARPKHIDLIVRACRELNLPLKVFGKGFAGYAEEIQEYSHPGKGALGDRIQDLVGDSGVVQLPRMTDSIEFVGEVSDEEKFTLMRGAKAYIFAAEDEDFGITPVEAMACGIPVIAYRSGGVVESVLEGKTGIFFDDLSIASLAKAIKQLNNITISSSDCIKQAEKFSKERFKKEIKKFVIDKYSQDVDLIW